MIDLIPYAKEFFSREFQGNSVFLNVGEILPECENPKMQAVALYDAIIILVERGHAVDETNAREFIDECILAYCQGTERDSETLQLCILAETCLKTLLDLSQINLTDTSIPTALRYATSFLHYHNDVEMTIQG